ncbi:glycosyltransferase family 2 protein [Sphingobium sp. BYY-5]|uniref:glycosyltransferase n=1 Tax=Sphingobium sp. BYY-5 TaxID=2926400 RepID=UPI001FA71F5B|nr:glycosyltransferase family A protein [Sphingobium sp. BYY-5]MCI4592664.1 glycosyltransferase family 2 protein [Sphingobium sp. BYY-5]
MSEAARFPDDGQTVKGAAVVAPLVSVIIPVWNSPDYIRHCLAALEQQTLPRDQYEIVVVDNGSTDDTASIARAVPGIIVLEETRPGSYAARNRALKEVRGTFVAFTDADCLPAPDWLEAALSAARSHPEFGVLAGRIELFDEALPDGQACGDYERIFSFPQAFAERGNCATANWVSRKDVFDRLGGFDAALKSGGDRQMALRIRDSGFPLIYVPEMLVRHPVRASWTELVRKRRRLSGGRWDRTRRPARLLRVLGATLYDAGRRLRRAALAPGLSIGRRLGVMRLTLALSAVAVGEFLRLAGGQRAARD